MLLHNRANNVGAFRMIAKYWYCASTTYNTAGVGVGNEPSCGFLLHKGVKFHRLRSQFCSSRDFAPNFAPFSGASSDNRHTKPAQKQDKNSKPTPPPTIWGEEEFSFKYLSHQGLNKQLEHVKNERTCVLFKIPCITTMTNWPFWQSWTIWGLIPNESDSIFQFPPLSYKDVKGEHRWVGAEILFAATCAALQIMY